MKRTWYEIKADNGFGGYFFPDGHSRKADFEEALIGALEKQRELYERGSDTKLSLLKVTQETTEIEL